MGVEYPTTGESKSTESSSWAKEQVKQILESLEGL